MREKGFCTWNISFRVRGQPKLSIILCGQEIRLWRTEKEDKDKDVYFQPNAAFLCKMGRKHFKSSRPRRLFFLFCDNLEDQKAYDMVAWWHGLVYGC